jgi:predicted transposase YbfD/YdcC
MSIFGQMKDPRRTTKGNLKHQFVDIVFLVISAVVSGCNDWESIEEFGDGQLDWLRNYYPFKNGIPSHDTINRLFSAMDTKIFGEHFLQWTQTLCNHTEEEVIAIDGKTMRGSYDRASNQAAIHIVSAYASKNRLCLGQVQTNEKSNEIKAIPELLDLLFLEKSTVTIDAMGCQKEITKKIREKKANYVIAVKLNQKELYEQIGKLFNITQPASVVIDYNKDHGRIESRKCTVIDELKFLDDSSEWEGLQSIIKIETERQTVLTGKKVLEERYYISSHKADAALLNNIIRDHWSIENKLHWVLDVVFSEDSSRKRMGNSATNFNIISKVALGLIEKHEYKKNKSKRQRRIKAGFDHKFRELILNL